MGIVLDFDFDIAVAVVVAVVLVMVVVMVKKMRTGAIAGVVGESWSWMYLV